MSKKVYLRIPLLAGEKMKIKKIARKEMTTMSSLARAILIGWIELFDEQNYQNGEKLKNQIPILSKKGNKNGETR